MSQDLDTKTVLITGGCSGIGLALAREFAIRGHGLVLVSQREEPLDRATELLRREHGVSVAAIVQDLAVPHAIEALSARVDELGLEVDVLVNNAGMFFFGEVADADLARANALLQLHVVTPSLLCAVFAKGMRERGRGHIMLVSSISAWRDFPGIAFYGASKRYLRSFACSLRSELGVWGVNVTCLAPGPTATNLYDTSGVDVARAKRYSVMMDPQVVARLGVEAMFARKAVCIPGLPSYLMASMAAWLPQFVVDAIRRQGPWLARPQTRASIEPQSKPKRPPEP